MELAAAVGDGVQVTRYVSIAAVAVAVLALVVSAITLWRSHLAKMRLVVAAGPATLRISHIESDSAEWFLPAVDVQVGFTNSGARTGRVLGLRMRVGYPDLPIPDAHEYFDLHSEVDSALYREHANNRFEWCRQAVVGNGVPFVLVAKGSVEKHLVFGSRWDDAVQQQLAFTLEVSTDKHPAWRAVETWDLNVDPFVWHQTVTVGTSYTVMPKSGAERLRGERHPKDLHKYTGVKGDVPSDGVLVGPSYLKRPSGSMLAHEEPSKPEAADHPTSALDGEDP